MTAQMATEDPIRVVTRRLYREFPEVREALINPLRRQRLFNLLLPLLAAGNQHRLEQCIEAVYRGGYYVSKTPPDVGPRHRTGDHLTSVKAAESLTFRADSQKGLLLAAFAGAGDAGLNAIEACLAARLSEQSCYWKRVGELNTVGMIERLEDAYGVTVTRPGHRGVEREVYVITPAGRGRLSALED